MPSPNNSFTRETESSWNMNKYDIEILHEARISAHQMLLQLRKNIEVVVPYTDAMYSWFMILLPYCGKEESLKIEEMFKKLYKDAEDSIDRLNFEKKQSQNPYLALSTPEPIRAQCVALMRQLYLTKQAKGLGIEQSQYYKTTKDPIAVAKDPLNMAVV